MPEYPIGKLIDGRFRVTEGPLDGAEADRRGRAGELVCSPVFNIVYKFECEWRTVTRDGLRLLDSSWGSDELDGPGWYICVDTQAEAQGHEAPKVLSDRETVERWLWGDVDRELRVDTGMCISLFQGEQRVFNAAQESSLDDAYRLAAEWVREQSK